MGITYNIDAEAHLVWLHYEGESTIADFAATMMAIFREPEYRPGFGFVSDRRGAQPVTKEYVDGTIAFARAHPEKYAGARWATVVSSPVNYGLGRMAQTLAEIHTLPVQIKVFQKIAEAEAWLAETDPLK